MKRISLLLILSLSSSLLFAQKKKVGKDTTYIILFVCEHGAAKSTIAATYFNKIANEKHLKYRAVFRGTNPDSTISPATNKGLSEDGFDTKNLKPILASQNDIINARQIVTFDCSIANKDSLNKPFYQWNGIPPISDDYQVAKNQIVSKVEALINNLIRKYR
jgi:arsenate reductase